jgi:hypothetical protein
VAVWAFKKAKLLPLDYQGPVSQLGKNKQYLLIDCINLKIHTQTLTENKQRDDITHTGNIDPLVLIYQKLWDVN